MSDKKIFLVEVEFCTNCHVHSGTTRHDEAKYLFYFQKIKNAVQLNSSNQIQVHAMLPPQQFIPANQIQGDNKFFNRKTQQIEYFPNLGAFQVYVNQILISSKLVSNKWPNIDFVVNTILEMYLKLKEGSDLTEYQISRRVIEKPKYKAKLLQGPTNPNYDMFRIREYEKNMYKKQKEFYDNYVKMSKTFQIINRQSISPELERNSQALPIVEQQFQSVSLNPEHRYKSIGQKSTSKASSKAKRRLIAHQGSLDKREPFFPTIDINEAYNPTIQFEENNEVKKRQSQSRKTSQSNKRRKLIGDFRKQALEQALFLQKQKLEVQEKLIKFYEKHEGLFESLRNSRKIKVSPKVNLQGIGNKKNQVDKRESFSSEQLEAIQNNYLAEVMKDEELDMDRIANQEKQVKILKQLDGKKSSASDKKQPRDSRRKLIGVVTKKNSNSQKKETSILQKEAQKVQNAPVFQVQQQKGFQKWISKQLKEQNAIEQSALIQSNIVNDDSLIRHLNDIKGFSANSSEEDLQKDSRVKKLMEKMAMYENRAQKIPSISPIINQNQNSANNQIVAKIKQQQKKQKEQKILQFLSKQEQKYQNQGISPNKSPKLQKIPSPSPKSKKRISIVNTTNLTIVMKKEDLPEKQIKKQQLKQQPQGQTKMVKCSKGCDRQFNQESIQKHELVCEKVFQEKRPVFDVSSKRTTEQMRKASISKQKHRNDKTQEMNPKWMAQSQQMRKGIQQAKQKKKQEPNPMELSIQITDEKFDNKKIQVFENKGGEFKIKKEENKSVQKQVNQTIAKPQIKLETQTTQQTKKIENIEIHSQQLYKKQKQEALGKLALMMREKEKQKVVEIKKEEPKLLATPITSQPKKQEKVDPKQETIQNQKPAQKKPETSQQIKLETKPSSKKLKSPIIEAKKEQLQKESIITKDQKVEQKDNDTIKQNPKPQEKKTLTEGNKLQENREPPKSFSIQSLNLVISSISGQFFKDFDTFGNMDPFVEFNLKNQKLDAKKFRTQVAKDAGKSARWDDVIRFEKLSMKNLDFQQIEVRAYDEDITENEFMGKGMFFLRDLLNLDKKKENSYKISLIGSDNTTLVGQITFSFNIIEQNPTVRIVETLLISEIECKFLKNFDGFGKMQAFLTFELDDHSLSVIRTSVMSLSDNLQGKLTNVVKIDSICKKGMIIVVKAFDQDATEDEFIGMGQIKADSLKERQVNSISLDIIDTGNKIVGNIKLNCCFVKNNGENKKPEQIKKEQVKKQQVKKPQKDIKQETQRGRQNQIPKQQQIKKQISMAPQAKIENPLKTQKTPQSQKVENAKQITTEIKPNQHRNKEQMKKEEKSHQKNAESVVLMDKEETKIDNAALSKPEAKLSQQKKENQNSLPPSHVAQAKKIDRTQEVSEEKKAEQKKKVQEPKQPQKNKVQQVKKVEDAKQQPPKQIEIVPEKPKPIQTKKNEVKSEQQKPNQTISQKKQKAEVKKQLPNSIETKPQPSKIKQPVSDQQEIPKSSQDKSQPLTSQQLKKQPAQAPKQTQEPVKPVQQVPKQTQEPVKPVQQVPKQTQEPVKPVQQVPKQTQEPVKPVQQVPKQTQEPVKPVQQVPKQTQEPVKPVQQVPKQTQEPVKPVQQVPKQTQEPVKPVQQVPKQTQEPVKPVQQVPKQTQEPVKPVQQVPKQTQEPVKPVQQVPKQTQEPVKPVQQVPKQTQEPVKPVQQVPKQTQEPVKPVQQVPKQTQEPVKPVQQVPKQTQEPIKQPQFLRPQKPIISYSDAQIKQMLSVKQVKNFIMDN